MQYQFTFDPIQSLHSIGQAAAIPVPSAFQRTGSELQLIALIVSQTMAPRPETNSLTGGLHQSTTNRLRIKVAIRLLNKSELAGEPEVIPDHGGR